MVATPYTGALYARTLKGNENYPISIAGDDVDTNLWTFPDLGSGVELFSVPVNTGGLAFYDTQVSGAGADTTRVRLIVDGRDTRVVLQNATIADPTASPIARSAGGFKVAPGSQLQVRQLA